MQIIRRFFCEGPCSAEHAEHAYIRRWSHVSLFHERAVHTVYIITRSSSSKGGEYYLGGIMTLLLQDHRTMSTKSVCISQYMMINQH